MQHSRTLAAKRGSLPFPGQDLLEATLEARAALRDAATAAAEAADRARSLADHLDEALVALTGEDSANEQVTTATPRSARLGARLSSREQEVLALVAEGRSNKAIAEALFLSPNTIKTHVASLLNKLSADSRSHLAAIAARQDRFGPRGPEFIAI